MCLERHCPSRIVDMLQPAVILGASSPPWIGEHIVTALNLVQHVKDIVEVRLDRFHSGILFRPRGFAIWARVADCKDLLKWWSFGAGHQRCEIVKEEEAAAHDGLLTVPTHRVVIGRLGCGQANQAQDRER